MDNMNCKFCKELKGFVDFAMDRLHQFNILDAGIFKICLLSLGILLGVYYHRQFKKLSPLIWLMFIASYGYLLFSIFFKKTSVD